MESHENVTVNIAVPEPNSGEKIIVKQSTSVVAVSTTATAGYN